MARRRRAIPPTSEQLAEFRKGQEAERRVAAPAELPEKLNHKCNGHLYEVVGAQKVHGKNRGETLTLCPHEGSTEALVLGGAVVPAGPVPPVPTEPPATPAKVEADNKKEADRG